MPPFQAVCKLSQAIEMKGCVLLLFVTGTCLASGQTCSCSPFEYEEKLLTKMIRQEFMFEKFKDDMLALQNKVIDKLKEMDNERVKYKSEVTEERETLRNEIAKMIDNTTEQMQNYAEEFQTLKDTLQNEVKEERVASKAEVKEELETLKYEFTNSMVNNTKQMTNHSEEFQKLKETLRNGIKEETNISKTEITNIISNNTKQMKNQAVEFQKLKDALDADTVAFFSKDVSDLTPSNGQTFIFTTSIINEGNGYNKVTGKFTAPVGGLFKFDLQFCLSGGRSNYIQFDILADNNQVQRGYFRDNDTPKCYTADALVRLQTGGTVWVKCHGCGGSMWQDSDAWNTFSGIRIHA